MSPFRPRWTPAAAPGLKLWLDAADISTLAQNSDGSTPVTADNDPIGYWADKSGNGNHATQATTSAKPTYKTNIQNGQPVARFDSGDIMTLALLNALRNVGSADAFAVLTYSSGTLTGCALYYSTNNSGFTRFALTKGTVSGQYAVSGRRNDGDSIARINGGTVNTSTLAIQHGFIDYANSDAYLYIDNTQVASNTSFLTNGNTSNTDSAYASIGNDQGGGIPMIGDLAELCMVVPAQPSLRTNFATYFSLKYGITI